MTKRKPILTLDFDGVIHSYTSGWKGAAVIPDPPVPGALEFIVRALDKFEVNILSSRSHQWGGRRAMKRWLYEHLFSLGVQQEVPEWLLDRIFTSACMDPWDHEVDWSVGMIIKEIRWPLFKPASLITIDDRALTFTGQWPELSELMAFKPWNKRKA